jgi:hypothetical protein
MKPLAALLLAQACFAGYTTVIPVTFDHTKIPNTNQTSFVNMVCANGSTSANCDATAHTNLALAQLKTIANGGVLTNSSGYDAVWFGNSNCTSALNFELVPGSYSATTGTAEFHVQKTRSHTVDDVIYLCLGNAAVVTYQGSITTWSGSSYVAALHLQALTGSVFPNSASTGSQDCTTASPMTLGTSQIFNGVAVGGAAGGGPCNDSNYPTGGAAWTLEAWMKTPTASGAEALWGFGENVATDGSRASFYWENTNKVYVNTLGNSYIGINFTPDSSWHHFAASYAGGGATTDSTLFYLDGVAQTTIKGPTSNTVVFNIGSPSPNSCYGVLRIAGNCAGGAIQDWQGDADELRLSTVARSADWIVSEYNNISSPSTFYTFGAPFTPGGGIRHRVVQ